MTLGLYFCILMYAVTVDIDLMGALIQTYKIISEINRLYMCIIY